MKIELREVTVRELAEGYVDNKEGGVMGYGGRLDIRPPFQREFIYKDKQRDAVIDTATKGFPLNVMYWAVREGGESFEIIDGQQRTIALCQYVANGEFSFNGKYFHNLQEDEKANLLDYKLMVYFCSGTDTEKLQWFETINIAGEELTNQELLNAIYSGSWVSDARRYFSKNGCAAYNIGNKYLKGSCIRQDYLETAIKWISEDEVIEYMAKHQHDPDAKELWEYFQGVINWVGATFTKARKEMKGIDWGELYAEFKDKKLCSIELEKEVASLMKDEDVERKSGIYHYVLTRKEKYLNLRTFSDNQKTETYEKQEGICAHCKQHFDIDKTEADHITPWHEGGKTTNENCQILCKECNRRKGGR